MSVTIRDAAPGDVATILRFVRELAEFEREGDKVVATEPLLHEAMFGERPVAEAVIAERDGTPLGMALFFHNFSTWTGWKGLYLEDLYVTPEARGSGIGGALLKHLAGIAVDRGCTRFEWSVLDWNARAIEFYRSMGAEAMDEWTVNRVSGAALAKLAGRG
jgi:GNAT superfamily N-acetyltransferase